MTLVLTIFPNSGDLFQERSDGAALVHRMTSKREKMLDKAVLIALGRKLGIFDRSICEMTASSAFELLVSLNVWMMTTGLTVVVLVLLRKEIGKVLVHVIIEV